MPKGDILRLLLCIIYGALRGWQRAAELNFSEVVINKTVCRVTITLQSFFLFIFSYYMAQ